MTCGSTSYPKSKDNTVGLLNNYHVIKQLICITPAKEKVEFTQTNIDTKMIKTSNKG